MPTKRDEVNQAVDFGRELYYLRNEQFLLSTSTDPVEKVELRRSIVARLPLIRQRITEFGSIEEANDLITIGGSSLTSVRLEGLDLSVL